MPIASAIPSIIGVGQSLYGARQQRRAASQASQAQVQAGQQAIDEQRRMYEQIQGNMSPYTQAGAANLAQMQALNAGDFSSFHESPDYQFALSEGIKGLDRSAAARGRLYSGGYGEDLTRFGQGLATQNYGNYYDRLARLAGMGQQSASDLSRYGAAMAGGVGDILLGQGQARASAYQQRGDTNTQLGQALGGYVGDIFGQYYQPRPYGGGAPWTGQALPGQTIPNQGGWVPGNSWRRGP